MIDSKMAVKLQTQALDDIIRQTEKSEENRRKSAINWDTRNLITLDGMNESDARETFAGCSLNHSFTGMDRNASSSNIGVP